MKFKPLENQLFRVVKSTLNLRDKELLYSLSRPVIAVCEDKGKKEYLIVNTDIKGNEQTGFFETVGRKGAQWCPASDFSELLA